MNGACESPEVIGGLFNRLSVDDRFLFRFIIIMDDSDDDEDDDESISLLLLLLNGPSDVLVGVGTFNRLLLVSSSNSDDVLAVCGNSSVLLLVTIPLPLPLALELPPLEAAAALAPVLVLPPVASVVGLVAGLVESSKTSSDDAFSLRNSSTFQSPILSSR